MALFPSRQVLINSYQGTAGFGNAVTFTIPRTFFGDSALLVIPITVAAPDASATFSTPGFMNAVKNINFQISDGTSNRSQTYATAWGLVRKGVRVLDQLDSQTLLSTGAGLSYLQSIDTASKIPTGTFYVTIPILWRTTQVSDPNGSATLLPLPRYNTDPTLTVTFGAVADIVTSTVSGLTLTIGSPYVTLIQRELLNVSFPVFDTQLAEIQFSQSGAGNNIIQNLPTPGNYTLINMYGENSSRQGIGPETLQAAGAPWILQFIGQSLRQFNLRDIKTLEQYTQAVNYFTVGSQATLANAVTDPFQGVYHLNFINDNFGAEAAEFGSVLNSNPLAGTGSLVQIVQNFGAAANMSYLYEQILGTISALTFAGAAANG